MSPPRYKLLWLDFLEKLENRLEKGHREYGDGSFDKPLLSLVDEVEEEIMDQILWSFIGWSRLESLRGRIKELERKPGLDTSE